MRRTTTVIIGAGHSGLAMSHELSRRSLDHVVIERGRIGESWLSQRWESMRLLTPNWMNGVSGQAVRDPDGYMTAVDFAGLLSRAAAATSAPVMTHTEVISVRTWGDGHIVQTDQGAIACDSVVLATGAFALPRLPACGNGFPASIMQVPALSYRKPDQLPEGAVLVVGASASGLQIARELALAGRRVKLAVGQHGRLPRCYRGSDILMWMHLTGVLDVPFTKVEDLARVRSLPSLPLLGDPAQHDVDLNSLQALGVEIVGRLAAVTGGKAWFSGSLAHVCAAADLKMNRLLDRIDAWIESKGIGEFVEPPERLPPTMVPGSPVLSADLSGGALAAVIWATGAAPDHSFVEEDVFDAKGRIRHEGGIVGNGLYVMGLPYQRTARSSHISGAGREARAFARRLVSARAISAAA
ncbi:FAD-dependent oxidoreductase [Aestuariivirga sp.]|uniref:FAD-dependent oxidoreductase n=1 Tax=Aestuariivirga sp. TaxID=2650926 RepID=UPI00391D0923